MISQLYLTPIAFIIGSILLIMLIIDGVNVQVSWLRHITTTASILLLILAAFDRWLWKSPLLNGWFAKRPDINGTWKVIIQTNWVNPKTQQVLGPITGYMAVRQTFSTLSMRLMTGESNSKLRADKIVESNDGTFQIVGVFINQPLLHLRGNRSEIHNGALILDIRGIPPQSLDGHYWTDRNTRGTMSFVAKEKKIFSTFDEANAAFSTRKSKAVA